MKLGAIGDDFTGSSDLANTLAKEGMRVTQFAGVPDRPAPAWVDAGVVALKSRTIPVPEARRLVSEALDWLMAQGCTQIFFKYCSTFDSTKEGNIGPVIDLLMERLGASSAIVCPAFPATGRSLYQGHLFVNGRLLSECGMENHPLTPMTDPDIRRWLGHQTRHAVGHVATPTVLEGAPAIRNAVEAEVEAGRPVIVVDAIRDADLRAIGEAVADQMLVTGGSGVALGLPENLLAKDELTSPGAEWMGMNGPSAILAGSNSDMTRTQIALYAERNPAMQITAEAVIEGKTTPEKAVNFVLNSEGSALVYSSTEPEAVRIAQERYGRETVASALEAFFAEVARQLVDGGVQRLVIAGGETSGAVVEGLGLTAFHIGPEIAPGVPALQAHDRELVLALKSGNFGDDAFFAKAINILGGAT